MTAKHMCPNFSGFRCSPPLTIKIVHAFCPPSAEHRCKNRDTNIIQNLYYASHPNARKLVYKTLYESGEFSINQSMLFSKMFRDICLVHTSSWKYFFSVPH